MLATLVLLPLAIVRLTSGGSGSEGSGVPGPGAAGATSTSQGPSSPAAPSTSPTASTSPTVVASGASGLPACDVGDDETPDADYDDWARTLLDTRLRLPDGYEPPDLVPIARAGFDEHDLLVRSFVIPDLRALRDAAEDADAALDVIAAYRSYVLQSVLFQRRVHDLGMAKAIAHTAAPGHSEHQLGTTLDFKLPDEDDVDESFADTSAGRWLASNAYRFGFVQSYPAGRSGVTCYDEEPWHYRFVGRERAEQVHASGLTLREFLWREGPSG